MAIGAPLAAPERPPELAANERALSDQCACTGTDRESDLAAVPGRFMVEA
jgi:hypothetical protein